MSRQDVTWPFRPAHIGVEPRHVRHSAGLRETGTDRLTGNTQIFLEVDGGIRVKYNPAL